MKSLRPGLVLLGLVLLGLADVGLRLLLVVLAALGLGLVLGALGLVLLLGVLGLGLEEFDLLVPGLIVFVKDVGLLSPGLVFGALGPVLDDVGLPVPVLLGLDNLGLGM